MAPRLRRLRPCMCILRPLLAVTLPIALTAGLIALAQRYGRASVIIIGKHTRAPPPAPLPRAAHLPFGRVAAPGASTRCHASSPGTTPSQSTDTPAILGEDSKPSSQQPHRHSAVSKGGSAAFVGRFLKEDSGSYLFEWPLSTIRHEIPCCHPIVDGVALSSRRHCLTVHTLCSGSNRELARH